MIKSTFIKLTFLFALAISFTACDKYEEGANFSLLTAKMRMTNTWTSSSYTIQSTLGTSTSNEMTLIIKKDGSFEQTATIGIFPTSTTTGTWGFNSDKTQLLLTEGSSVVTWDIIKLKNKELKLNRVYTFGTEVTETIEFAGE